MENPTPFSYYRSPAERRAFLVADVDAAGTFNNGKGRVLLIEWGKGNAGKWVALGDFLHFVHNRSLIEFTPNFSDNAG